MRMPEFYSLYNDSVNPRKEKLDPLIIRIKRETMASTPDKIQQMSFILCINKPWNACLPKVFDITLDAGLQMWEFGVCMCLHFCLCLRKRFLLNCGPSPPSGSLSSLSLKEELVTSPPPPPPPHSI